MDCEVWQRNAGLRSWRWSASLSPIQENVARVIALDQLSTTYLLGLGRLSPEIKDNRCSSCATHQARPRQNTHERHFFVFATSRIAAAPRILNEFLAKKSLSCVAQQGLASELIRVTLLRVWCFSVFSLVQPAIVDPNILQRPAWTSTSAEISRFARLDSKTDHCPQIHSRTHSGNPFLVSRWHMDLQKQHTIAAFFSPTWVQKHNPPMIPYTHKKHSTTPLLWYQLSARQILYYGTVCCIHHLFPGLFDIVPWTIYYCTWSTRLICKL